MLDVPLFADLLGPHHIHAIAHKGRLVKKNMVIHNLSVVFVRGHHVDSKMISFCFFGDRADDVICLKSIHFQHGDLEGFHNFFDPRDRNRDILRLLESVGLVGLVLNMSEGGCFGIKSHRDVAWFFFFQYFQKCIGKSEHHTRIETFRIDSWVFAKCKMCPIDQGHGVQQKEFMGLFLRHIDGIRKTNRRPKIRNYALGFDCFWMNRRGMSVLKNQDSDSVWLR